MGPHLQYQEVNNKVNLSCTVEEVFPEPKMALDWDYDVPKLAKEEHNDKFRYCWVIFEYANNIRSGCIITHISEVLACELE